MTITAENIDQTIAVLRERGWVRGVLSKYPNQSEWQPECADDPVWAAAPEGAVCLFGAWNVARTGSWGYISADSAGGSEFAQALGFADPITAVEWNNAQTSAEPVIARLEAAAARLREEKAA